MLKVVRPDFMYRKRYLRNLMVMFFAVVSSLFSLLVRQGRGVTLSVTPSSF